MKTQRSGIALGGGALFLLGGALFAVSAWLPWVTYVGYTTANTAVYFDPGRSANLPFLGALGDRQGVLAAWSLITILGVALAPLLTVRAPRWLARAGHALAGLWLLATSVLFVAILIGIAQDTYAPALQCPAGPVCNGPALAHMLDLGFYLAPLGILLAWIGWALATGHIWQSDESERSATRGRFRERALQNGLLAVGLILWAAGFYSMPWATVNCGTQITLLVRHCVGISASSALTVTFNTSSGAVDPLVATYAIPILLGLGAIELVYALAFGGLRSIRARGWTLGWLVVAVLVAVMAAAGVGIVARDAAHVGLPAGTWRADLGLISAQFGLFLVAVGLIISVAAAVGKRIPLPTMTKSK